MMGEVSPSLLVEKGLFYVSLVWGLRAWGSSATKALVVSLGA